MKPSIPKPILERAQAKSDTYGKKVYVSENLNKTIRIAFTMPRVESTKKEVLIFHPTKI